MSCSRTTPLLRLVGQRAFAPVVRVPASRALSTEAATTVTEDGFQSQSQAERRPRRDNRDRSRRDSSAPRGIEPAQKSQSLPELLGTLTRLKAEGRTPTAAAYLALIRAAADYGARRGTSAPTGVGAGAAKAQASEAEASEATEATATEGLIGNTLGLEIALGAIRDAEAAGISLGSEALDELFRFTFVQPEILPSLLIEAANTGKPTAGAYETLAQHAIGSARLEEVVVVFSEMLEQNLSPSRGMTKQLVRLACEWGLPRLALQVIEEAESLPNAGRTESSAWVQVLQVSADESFLEGVEKAWARTVASRHFTPDEGLLIKILAVAGRWGRTGLATQALAVLPKIGVRAQEHHMAPLIEAFCREGRVPDALKAVGQIRASGITPTMATVSQIVAVLNTPELLDQAFYTLEDMHKAGDAVDVVAFNAVIAAADKLRDLQRARATQLAAADLGVTPNIDTFNYVLRACRSGRHRQLGDDVLAEMTAAGVHPDAESYEHMIHLCLTQTSYEDAFWYLEKMKAEGFRPRQQLYTAIGKRLARNDDSRHKLVAEEMGTLGYAVPDFPALVERENTRRERKGGSNEEGQPPRTDNRSRQSGQRRPRRDNQNRSE